MNCKITLVLLLSVIPANYSLASSNNCRVITNSDIRNVESSYNKATPCIHTDSIESKECEEYIHSLFEIRGRSKQAAMDEKRGCYLGQRANSNYRYYIQHLALHLRFFNAVLTRFDLRE